MVNKNGRFGGHNYNFRNLFTEFGTKDFTSLVFCSVRASRTNRETLHKHTDTSKKTVLDRKTLHRLLTAIPKNNKTKKTRQSKSYAEIHITEQFLTLEAPRVNISKKKKKIALLDVVQESVCTNFGSVTFSVWSGGVTQIDKWTRIVP